MSGDPSHDPGRQGGTASPPGPEPVPAPAGPHDGGGPRGRSSHRQASERQEAADAFRSLVEPHLDELLSAATRELEYRQALGELSPHDLSPEELVGETLIRAWRDRHRRPPLLDIRSWLLGLLFRVAENLVRREERLREAVVTSPAASDPPPRVYDDDGAFWEWHQPDEAVGRSLAPPRPPQPKPHK